ncbi:hypothetical protein SAMN05660830_00776 [Halodesulfovibrio aestuarii]|uniref:Uncharacterized protein n=1 Tax=Halodesulfovibrio aestuarii TaxID=126333 RepID=A0A8G2C7Y1_9BACT|nr:hypothetical protein SAMN05660830_00776 [Halodesulfovibrio aestuarii]
MELILTFQSDRFCLRKFLFSAPRAGRISFFTFHGLFIIVSHGLMQGVGC